MPHLHCRFTAAWIALQAVVPAPSSCVRKETLVAQDILTSLRTIDPVVLTDVVRQDQRSSTFAITEWAVAPLSHHTIIDTTGGLYCFTGRGRDEQGERTWSVVLKIVNNPGHENAQNPRNWAYWKREQLAFQSGVLPNLPSPLIAPRCYGVREDGNGAWIWMEHIVEMAPRRWTLEEYARAARHFGTFQAAYVVDAPYKDEPWLTDGFFRSVYAPNDWWTPHMDPAQPGNTWESPVTQAWYTADRKARTLSLFAERETFLAILDRLPPVLCHNDAHRRNLLLCKRPDGQYQTVALDWAFAGRGALGADTSELVMTSLFFLEQDPTLVADLATSVLDGYIAGLCDAGWNGDVRVVRLAYLASVALGFGISMPGWIGFMLGEELIANTTQQFGRSADEIARAWMMLWEYAQTCADEARDLMRELGLM
jgi:hypothetical protein